MSTFDENPETEEERRYRLTPQAGPDGWHRLPSGTSPSEATEEAYASDDDPRRCGYCFVMAGELHEPTCYETETRIDALADQGVLLVSILDELIQNPAPRKVDMSWRHPDSEGALTMRPPAAPLFRPAEAEKAWTLVICRTGGERALNDEQARYARATIETWLAKLPAGQPHPRFAYLDRDGIQWAHTPAPATTMQP